MENKIDIKNSYVNTSRWANKSKLGKDFNKLNLFFEKILKILSKKLNKIHKIDNRQRSWRLVLGPWLSMFIYIFFERYSNIEKTIKSKKIDKCIFLNFDKEMFIPYDNREFTNFANEDYWNQYIYQKIAEKNLFQKKNNNKKN